MSATSTSFSAEPMTGGIPQTGRTPTSGRAGGLGSATSGLLSSSDDLWRRTLQRDDDPSQGGSGRNPQQRGQSRYTAATPLMARQAASYPASETAAAMPTDSSIFLADSMHGAELYEASMKRSYLAPANAGRVLTIYS